MRNLFVRDYQTIWDKFLSLESFEFKDVLKRDFLFQFDDVKNPDVVFVGINPSYGGGIDDRKTYCIDSLKTSYFKPFKDILDTIHLNVSREIKWTHLDLLVFRETRQDFITKKLFKNHNGRIFLKEQLVVSISLLEYYNPKIIVVSNALARRLFKKETGIRELDDFGYIFEFNNDFGTDVISKGFLKGTPVFFTSMLSGQRALDTGSRQRLEWHIAKVLEDI